jgi:hypothetical protein
MIPLISALLGFALGWFRASKAGKPMLDRLQYGAAHGIGIGLIGLIGSVIFLRMMM